MIALLRLVLAILASPFKSKCQVEAENVALGHQAVVLRREVCRKVRLTNIYRLFLVQLYRWFFSILLAILPMFANETLATNANELGQLSSNL